VAAFFLCLANEETAFWLLYAVTQKLCPGYYVQSMIQIRADSDVIANLIDQDLKDHIENIRVPIQGVCVASLMQLYVSRSLLFYSSYIHYSHFKTLGVFRYILKLPTVSVLRFFDFLFLEGSAVMILLELLLFKSTKESLLNCTGIVEFSAALLKTETSMFAADQVIRGILDEMNCHGGLRVIRQMQAEAVAKLERNDLQILHDELSTEISHLPKSNLATSPIPDDGNRRNSTSSFTSTSSTATSSSSSSSSSVRRKRYMSDSDFKSLYDTFNLVVVTRSRNSRRQSLTTKQRLSLEMQCQDYRNLSFPEFCKLMDALGVIRDDSISKQEGADAAASKLLRNIVKSLTERNKKKKSKTSKLSILRALFNFFDHDNDGKINSKEFLGGMVMLDPTNKGHVDERLELFFKLFDVDGNGTLEPDEVSRLHKWLRRVNGITDMDENIESPSDMLVDRQITDKAMNVKEFIASVHFFFERF